MKASPRNPSLPRPRDEKKQALKKVAIVQSNYIPWKGYFDLIAHVDEFILYDDMQFTKRDWRNRNKIKTAQGLIWLTIPVQVRGKFHQKIRHTLVSDRDWPTKHWKAILNNYKKAPYFDEVTSWLQPLYEGIDSAELSVINRRFIESICNYLAITTKISNSWDHPQTEGQSERLASLCLATGAKTYVSGPAAKDYLDESIFEQQHLEVEWFDYSHYPVHPQLWGDFEHSVSILDLLFNCGKASLQWMKSNKAATTA